MNRLLKLLLFSLFIKPIILIVLGLNIRNKQLLPLSGPAVIAANHNSHLDTLVLMSLYPLSIIHKIRPVAAADYFLQKKGILAWLALNCIGIIPIERNSKKSKEELFSGCHEALDNNDILIIFPEGSRGNPEEIGRVKTGLYHLINERDNVQVTPVVMHGLGKALPKGEALFVPFTCDVIIGDSFKAEGTARSFTDKLSASFKILLKYCITKNEEK